MGSCVTIRHNEQDIHLATWMDLKTKYRVKKE